MSQSSEVVVARSYDIVNMIVQCDYENFQHTVDRDTAPRCSRCLVPQNATSDF